MINNVPMNLAELTKLALPTLDTLPADERAEAIRWLRDNVATTTSIDVQQILFSSWLSVHDRRRYEAMFADTRNE